MKKLALLLIILQALPLMGQLPNPLYPKDCWGILGFNIFSRFFANDEDINKAYKGLIRTAHPDHNNASDALQATVAINTARDEALRALDGRISTLKFIALVSAIGSLALTKNWYQQLLPYEPFLQIDAYGIATSTKQVPWGRVLNIYQKSYGSRQIIEVMYAKPDNVRGTLALNLADLPCSEKQLFDFFNEFITKNNETAAPVFSTASLTKQQLRQLKSSGIYKDQSRVILCHAKSNLLTLSGLSLAVYGTFVISIYELYRLKWLNFKLPGYQTTHQDTELPQKQQLLEYPSNTPV